MNSIDATRHWFRLARDNEMDNKTLYMTLTTTASVALLFTLILYTLMSGRNPVPRLSYGLFVSILPAIGTFVVLKLTRISVSRRWAVVIYLLLFLLVLSQNLIRSNIK